MVTRADLIKLVSHQLQDEVELAKECTAARAGDAKATFRRAVSERVLEECSELFERLLLFTGGCGERIVVDVKYELFDDELESPSEKCEAIVRDGSEYDHTFRFRVPIHMRGSVGRARDGWIKARRLCAAAKAASARMTGVRKEAWSRVVGAILDETSAGAELLQAAAAVRKELKADGYEALLEKLK